VASGPDPEVVAGPTSGVGPNEWIFVSLYNFPPGDEPDIQYCTDVAPLSAAAPFCDEQGSQTFPNPSVRAPIDQNGTASISFEVEEVTNDGTNAPLSGTVPGTGTSGTFFCDDTPDPCSIDVTDPALVHPAELTPVAGNTAVIPMNFAPASTGCPGATDIATESDYGLQYLLVPASTASCQGSQPAIALNTELDGPNALQALANHTVQVAFTDDPEAVDQKAALAGGSYAYIPVAATANVVGFKAVMLDAATHQGFADNLFNLSPTMVAGLVTNYYSYPDGSDLVPCHAGDPCVDPVPCPTGPNCTSLLALANPTGTFTPPQLYGAYVRADTTGTTDSLLHWICDAPNVPVPVPGGSSVFDTANTAAATLQAGIQPTETACPNTDKFPALPSASAYWGAESNPSQQIKYLEGYGGFVSPPGPSADNNAGFAPMLWSDAEYYGLDVANLLNAAGQWVAPSDASIDAALADATSNADGTLTPSVTDAGDPAAYPMPVVIYAVVSTAAAPQALADAEKSMLKTLVATSSAPSDLPAGFVPLPAGIAAQATAEIADSIQAAAPSPAPTSGGGTGAGAQGWFPSSPSTTGTGGSSGATPTGSSGAPTAPGTGGSAPSGSPAGPSGQSSAPTSGPAAGASYVNAVFAHAAPLIPGGTASAPTQAAPAVHRAVTLVVPTPAPFALVASDRPWAGPGFVVGLLTVVLLGPGLLAAIGIRRRRRLVALRGAGVTAAPGGPGPHPQAPGPT